MTLRKLVKHGKNYYAVFFDRRIMALMGWTENDMVHVNYFADKIVLAKALGIKCSKREPLVTKINDKELVWNGGRKMGQ